MNIDDLFQDMQADRRALLDEKLSSIERQVMLRRLESIGLSVALINHIDDLTQQILQLQEKGGMGDDRRQERQALERERRDRQVQLQGEAVQKWRDVQMIQQEERHDQKERREEEQRYEQINRALYDA